ncbi:phage tail protein [Streptomyces olivaceoviridis]
MRRVTTDIAAKKQKLAQHKPATAESRSAQDAAKAPPDDKEAQGKAANAEKMNAAEPGAFDKAAFIAAVNEAIAAQAPKNLDEADKFADSGKAEKVKGAVDGKVTDGKKASAKDIETTTKAAPDTSKAKEKQVVPLHPDQPPANPGAPSAADATPRQQPPEVTDFSEGPRKTGQQLADADVTEEQLARSNEPEFTAALGEKRKAEQHSVTAPAQARTAEKQQLATAKSGAAAAGAQAMSALTATRNAAGRQVDGGKGEAKSKDEQKREEVTAKLQKVFDATQKDVEGILEGLDGKVDKQFGEGEKKARDAFTTDQKRRMKAYKDKRYGGFWGPAKWAKDKIAGMPEEANQLFQESRKLYVRMMQGVISSIADTIGTDLGKAKARIAKGRAELRAEVDRLPADLKKYGEEAAKDFAGKFDDLESEVNDKSKQLVQTLAQKYTQALNAVDEEIKKLQEANKGLVQKAVDAVAGVIKTIKELKDLLMGILAKAAAAITKIIKDPIGFLGNLVRAVGAGLQQFISNIGTHLQSGLVSWLLGTAVKAGIEIPSRFDLKGIIQLIASLLGLTWANIRARITRKGVPDQAMNTVEQSVPVAKALATEGPAGAVNEIQAEVGDLKSTILEELKSYLIPTVIIAGITWIISLLNPASAFVRAVKGIIDIVSFIVNQGAQIVQFVNAVLDAVVAIANGGAAGVPKMVETALAASIPLLIGFLASLLGIGGLANKIKQVFQRVARPVNRAVDKIVGFIAKVGKKLWSRLRGRKGKGSAGHGKETRRSIDVKRKTREILARRTSKPLATRASLDALVGQTFSQLRPEGLQSLRLKPVAEGERRFSILAKASPEEPVAQVQLEYSSEDYVNIMRKAIPRGGIIGFLHDMANDNPKIVTYEGVEVKVGFIFFEKAWNDSQLVVDMVKDRFRGAMNAHHEWIPSNYILEVINRARNAVQDGGKWIEFQHRLRSETFRVVFKPDKVCKVERDSVNGAPEKDYTILQGHSGAVYYKASEQTKGQEDFHNALRAAFTGSTTPSGAATDALAVAEEWVWRGEAMAPDMHPDLFNRKRRGTRITAAYQAANFDKIKEHFKPFIGD